MSQAAYHFQEAALGWSLEGWPDLGNVDALPNERIVPQLLSNVQCELAEVSVISIRQRWKPVPKPGRKKSA